MMMKLTYRLDNEAHTLAFGNAIAPLLKPGDVIVKVRRCLFRVFAYNADKFDSLAPLQMKRKAGAARSDRFDLLEKAWSEKDGKIMQHIKQQFV